MPLVKNLTEKQRSRFIACKKIVKDGLQTCFQVGAALIEIRDDKLYVEDFDTFEEFSQETFGMERAHAYRLIDAAEVKSSVSVSPNGRQITNERQARALGKVPKDERVKVLDAVAEKGPVTAKSIEEYEPTEPKELSGPKEKEVVRDELGWPIPADLIPFWERRWILENMMKILSDLKCEVEKGWKEQDPLFLQMSNTTASELQGVRWSVKHARPWAVCTLCEGRPKLNVACAQCNSTGFILERLCETAPTVKDVLKIRAKILENQKAT